MRAVVDTTILVDALLKAGPEKKRAKRALARCSESILHRYALKEFRRGALSAYVWLHNKLVTSRSIPGAMVAISTLMPHRRNLPSTALQALAQAIETADAPSLSSLSSSYGADANPSDVNVERVILSLESTILRAFRNRVRLTTSLLGELHCFPDTAPRSSRGQIELDRQGCKIDRECSMAPELKADTGRAKVLWQATGTQASRPEITRRAKALRKVWRTPKRLFDASDCLCLGDAVFSFFAPPNSVVLTTNIKDHGPLARSVGLEAITPESLDAR
jgi:hypothetical protein